MDEKTKTFIATCLIILFFGILALGVIFVSNTIDDADQKVLVINQSLNADPDNEKLKQDYNEAVRYYLGTTAFFPGNVVGIFTGHRVNKWSLFDEKFGIFWNPLPKAMINNSNLSTLVGDDLKWASPQ